MNGILLYAFLGSAALAFSTVVIRLVALVSLYNVSKRNRLSIAGRFYDSLDQLGWDLALDFRLWRNPDLIRLADPRQRQYLASIQRWGKVGFLAWVTFFFVVTFVLIFLVQAIGE